jgi:hypothetical protein
MFEILLSWLIGYVKAIPWATMSINIALFPDLSPPNPDLSPLKLSGKR